MTKTATTAKTEASDPALDTGHYLSGRHRRAAHIAAALAATAGLAVALVWLIRVIGRAASTVLPRWPWSEAVLVAGVLWVAALIVALYWIVRRRRHVGSIEIGFAAAIAVAPAVLVTRYGIDLRVADSAVLLSAIKQGHRSGGFRWLIETQEALLPHLLYGPWVAVVDDPSPLVGINVVASVAVVAITAVLAFRLVGRVDVALLAGVALFGLATFGGQLRQLPLYPVFTALGTIGIYLLARHVLHPALPRWQMIAGAGAVVLTVAAHGAGLYFGVVAVLIVSLVRSVDELKRYFAAMLTGAALGIPWFATRVIDGGLTNIASPRNTWVLTQGYITEINVTFWGSNIGSRFDSALTLPSTFISSLGWSAWVIVPLAIAGWLALSNRIRLFVGLSAVGLALPLVLTRSAPFDRYFYPVLPAVIILAALGLVGSLKKWDAPRRLRRPVFVLAAVVVAAMAITEMQKHYDAATGFLPLRNELTALSETVGDSGVIGPRSFMIMFVNTESTPYHLDALTEEEYLAYLTWDEDSVTDVLNRHAIRYALLRQPAETWEVDYNAAWMIPAYGLAPRHAKVLETGSVGCRVWNSEQFELYQLVSCPSE